MAALSEQMLITNSYLIKDIKQLNEVGPLPLRELANKLNIYIGDF